MYKRSECYKTKFLDVNVTGFRMLVRVPVCIFFPAAGNIMDTLTYMKLLTIWTEGQQGYCWRHHYYQRELSKIISLFRITAMLIAGARCLPPGAHLSCQGSRDSPTYHASHVPRATIRIDVGDCCEIQWHRLLSASPLPTTSFRYTETAGAHRTNYPMTFFQGATDVKINGGEFTVVNGNYTVFDRSRHTSNVNSFNTTNNTTLGSYNDNSQRYCENFNYTFDNELRITATML